MLLKRGGRERRRESRQRIRGKEERKSRERRRESSHGFLKEKRL